MTVGAPLRGKVKFKASVDGPFVEFNLLRATLEDPDEAVKLKMSLSCRRYHLCQISVNYTYSKFNLRLINGGPDGNMGEAARFDPSGTIKGLLSPTRLSPLLFCRSLPMPLSPLENPTYEESHALTGGAKPKRLNVQFKNIKLTKSKPK